MHLVLHPGMGKTGTSTIQTFLRTNRATLLEHGVLYPTTPGQVRHLRLGLFITPDATFSGSRVAHRERRDPRWREVIDHSPAGFREAFRRALLDEVERSGASRVVLSDEAVFRAPDASLRILGDFTSAHAQSLRVVCYLRRQDDHLVSRYQQAVKTGEVRRMADRTDEIDLVGVYDFAGRLRAWERLVQPTQLIVRRFDRSEFREGSLIEDFLDAAGIAIPGQQLQPVPRRNESLDAESVEFLRLVNLHRVEAEGGRPGRLNNRKLTKRLTAACQGPTLTLPGTVLDAFMARWEAGNREVASKYFGEDGDLFHVPRKTEGTTVHQYLDPSRLPDLFDITELPRRLREPVRRLAEREAAVSRPEAGTR
ncbi:hypothetical protein [Nocardioides coralli]|uniref:hypothetical protein n=1 Tax=Nocardioides coralli TaxID=2872154 RepID=UPI001CA3AB37|nr:hypothetical protein [Nocardioides coralli]QZY28151.1 hypothetical protein K6T13_11715 [Nocardioides coralli]